MRNKFFNGFLFLQMTIFLLLLQLLSFYIVISIPSFRNVKDILNHNVFRLTDNFLGEKETDFYNSKTAVAQLKQFNEEISNNKLFKFYEINAQSIYIPYFEHNEIFINGYENGTPQPQANMKHNNQNITLVPVKSFQLSENVFHDFNIKLESGRMPKTGNWAYVKGDVIPILLGSEYRTFYEIGDSIDVYYLSNSPFKGKIIGFLEKGSNITINEEYMHYLDRCMVLPSFGFHESPQTDREKWQQFMQYLAKNSGIIVSAYDMQEISREISVITRNVGLEENSYVLINQKFANTLFNLTTDNLIMLLSCFFIIMSLLLIMSLNVLVKAFVESNMHFLSIHLLCGAGSFDLYKIILQRFLVIAAMSLMLSWIIFILMYHSILIETVLISTGVSLILIMVTVGYSCNKNVTVNNLLRRSE